MVDLAEIQAAYYMVAATGVLIAAVFYILNMRATLQTRQAQLLMQIYQRFSETDFMNKFLTTGTRELKDYDEFMKAYSAKDDIELASKLGSLFAYFEGIGVLVEEKLIDPRLVANLMSGNVITFWEKYGPFLLEYRRRSNSPREWDRTEFLYGEMKKIRGEDWSRRTSNSILSQ